MTAGRLIEMTKFVDSLADVMGRPIAGLPIYVPAPLRSGGESLDVVIAVRDRLSSVRVTSMPSVGASAPLQPFGARALAAAEVIGGGHRRALDAIYAAAERYVGGTVSGSPRSPVRTGERGGG